MGDINSSFQNGGVDRSQNFCEGIGALDVAGPALPVLEEAGKTFNSLQVKNPSVCKFLLVDYTVKQKDGTEVPEQAALCPGELLGISFKRPAITKVDAVSILDSSAITPGAWVKSGAYAAVAAPVADDFAEDGGSISPVVARLLDC